MVREKLNNLRDTNSKNNKLKQEFGNKTDSVFK